VSTPPVVLTIGGSDSGGCYGVQADLRTLAALGVHGACALTVVTAQNTVELRRATWLPVDMIAAQIEAVIEDLAVAAVKTGMLGRVEVIELIGGFAAAGRLPRLVVDPVLVNRHGMAVFGPDVVDAYRELLVPHAVLVTPNDLEAALLTGTGVPATVDVRRIGAPAVVTAGRGDGDADDRFWDGRFLTRLPAQRLATRNAAGSGDSFSAAIAARLAAGDSLEAAVGYAKQWTHAALGAATDWSLGAGPGPLDQLGWDR